YVLCQHLQLLSTRKALPGLEPRHAAAPAPTARLSRAAARETWHSNECRASPRAAAFDSRRVEGSQTIVDAHAYRADHRPRSGVHARSARALASSPPRPAAACAGGTGAIDRAPRAPYTAGFTDAGAHPWRSANARGERGSASSRLP